MEPMIIKDPRWSDINNNRYCYDGLFEYNRFDEVHVLKKVNGTEVKVLTIDNICDLQFEFVK